MQLRVYPNTGHQYFALKLKELLPRKSEEWLENLVQLNRGPWATWDSFTPWIRYQYALEQGVPLLKLAIETNLGMPSRGLLYDVDEALHASMPDAEEQVHPYASFDEAQIEEDYGSDRVMPLQYLPNKEGSDIEVDLAVYWPRPDGPTPIDVDLVVDLGNSRSVALLLENPGQAGPSLSFGRRVRILRFIPRGLPFQLEGLEGAGSSIRDDCAIIDSWLILHRPQFFNAEPPVNDEKVFDAWEGFFDSSGQKVFRRKRILPHTFVELSPALIGGGKSPEGSAQTLAGISLDHAARFTLSSPKRYAWDDELQETVWKQIPNPTDPNKPPDFFDDLSGLIRVFMDPGGIDWDIDNPPDEEDFRGMPLISARPNYPRRDAICWFALSILEAAHRQMNAPAYLESTGRENLPRRLRHIRVTYPAGWPNEERERYLDQWRRAVNLFTLTRFENHAPVPVTPTAPGGSRPRLSEEHLDEAMAAQLPILYSDITALCNDGETWFNLFGHQGRVTVMNVDIGGGTTDLAIIEYKSSSQRLDPRLEQSKMGTQTTVGLEPHLKFRYGHRIAGDALVKRIIEKILLPTWIAAAGRDTFAYVPEARLWIGRLFSNPSHNEFQSVDSKTPQRIVRIIRLVFIPLVNEWLSRLGRVAREGGGWEPLKVSDYVDPTTVRDLNTLVDKLIQLRASNGQLWRGPAFPIDDIHLKADRDALEACIDETFSGLFNSLAKLLGEFNGQMVIVSGKPSELPRVRELIEEAFPLIPQRIIQVKNFPAGSWYPFSSFESGRILDAKTCTVVGGALFQDMCNGNLEGFSVVPETALGLSRNYFWGLVTKAMLPEDFFNRKNLLFAPRDYPQGRGEEKELSVEKTFEAFPLNVRIGRQITRMKDVPPDLVYVLRWQPRDRVPQPETYAKVTLRWVSRAGEGEKLELVKVAPHPQFPDVDPDDISLQLNTMYEESFWLDDPRFDVEELINAAQ